MKKLLLLSAIIGGAASAAHAGVSFDIGFRLPHANVVISSRAPCAPAPIYVPPCPPAPVVTAPVCDPAPVISVPACPPVVVSPPVCAPAPVIVERPRMVVHRSYAPGRYAYSRFYHGGRDRGWGNNYGHR